MTEKIRLASWQPTRSHRCFFSAGDMVSAEYGWNTGMFQDAEVIKTNEQGKVYVRFASNNSKEWLKTDQVIIAKKNIANQGAELVYDSKISAATTTAVSTNTSGNRSTSQAIKTSGALAVGDRVEANYRGRGRFFKGKIGKLDGDKVHILYDDGGLRMDHD